MTRAPLILALSAAAVLMGVLAIEALTAGPAHAPPLRRSVAPIAAAPAVLPPVVLPPSPAQVDLILARPLFMATRRPPAVSAAPASGRPAGLPRLTGVMNSSTGKRLIFAPGADGKPVVVAEGGHIGAYEVKSIGVGEAVVSGPDGLKTLHPAFTSASGALPGAMGPAGAMLAGSADRNAVLELMNAARNAALPPLTPGTSAGMQPSADFAARTKTMTPRASPATTPGLQP